MKNWIKAAGLLALTLLLWGGIALLLREFDPSAPILVLLMQATLPVFAIGIIANLVLIYRVHRRIKRAVAEVEAEAKTSPPPEPPKPDC